METILYSRFFIPATQPVCVFSANNKSIISLHRVDIECLFACFSVICFFGLFRSFLESQSQLNATFCLDLFCFLFSFLFSFCFLFAFLFLRFVESSLRKEEKKFFRNFLRLLPKKSNFLSFSDKSYRVFRPHQRFSKARSCLDLAVRKVVYSVWASLMHGDDATNCACKREKTKFVSLRLNPT